MVRTRIFVFNNSSDILARFQKILAICDCEVFPRVFLSSNLREVRKVKPDLIILDFHMGQEATGWELLQRLNMEDRTAVIPVLICTKAVQIAQESAPYLATKHVRILGKPFKVRALVRAVHCILENDSGNLQAQGFIK